MEKHSLLLSQLQREIQAVLFDMDGVLADSIPSHIIAWNTALQAHHLPKVDRSAYLKLLGKTNLYMIDKILEWQGKSLPLETRQDIVETKERCFRELIKSQFQTTPGVIEWLDFLKHNQVHCSVASSGDMANITLVLDTLNISGYFTSILSGAHLTVSKPNPLVFQLAAASLDVEADKCLVIEDAPAGIQAARTAGMVSCGIATTLPRENLSQADILLDNLAQVSPETLFSHLSHPV